MHLCEPLWIEPLHQFLQRRANHEPFAGRDDFRVFLRRLDGRFPYAGIDANAVALAAVLGGAALGWLHASRWRLAYRPASSGLRVRLPGDASLLATLMLTFVAETGIHYAVAVHAPWAATGSFVMLSFAVWGVLVGMTLGRAVNVVVRCMRHANGSKHGSFPYSVDPR
ncbi:hypothetical protein [Burkholderia sp. HI2714]|uniref:hypothetical protein n=1 Tax=Burkholderia sp. HI2714 TaxID=2015359 RepID=UPI00211AD0CF|nr:hypothetical protein [Burkholderia sp. HI2714]